jgi:hypothetical protein
MKIEKKNDTSSENTQQSIETGTPNKTQEEGDEGNVDALLKTLEDIVNVFKMFDWVMEKGHLCILRKWLEEDVIKKTNSSNTINKVLERNYSNCFSRALNASRLIFL